ncbi:hypothetical protein [Mycoplasmopsis columboralis]|uniref:Uncharacterized protein n=1 Tax=Mycoplasmopsis columboralis TaxID=171282 RepID=A0A449B7C8_9BACT|nr:hypothetical protein [Mycoplasmopsis columboralis]VEU76490.1 Uncharacterised protein [Mycoplasmopsis columboralis]
MTKKSKFWILALVTFSCLALGSSIVVYSTIMRKYQSTSQNDSDNKQKYQVLNLSVTIQDSNVLSDQLKKEYLNKLNQIKVGTNYFSETQAEEHFLELSNEISQLINSKNQLIDLINRSSKFDDIQKQNLINSVISGSANDIEKLSNEIKKQT